ncbi:MAG: diadenylate cyclase CdaA [Acutalibacteraceae bacterium]
MVVFFKSLCENLLKLAASVRWNDILDILLITLVLYYCIKMFRQTRAMHLIKGLVFLVIVYLVVSALGMSTSTYVFSRLFSDIVVVLVLLFQPEIRHAIESFGRGDFKRLPFLSKNSDFLSENVQTSISSIVKACGNMSDKKVGALIVLEGKSPLGEIIATGSVVDAAISVPVIENIFYPKAPLHDGAMIIKDNRINSAGCILPLTENQINRELGTRHRAALGMSEHSDALIVVVSEETGAISVARDGVLTTGVTQGQLLEKLNHFFTSDKNEPQQKRGRKKDEK